MDSMEYIKKMFEHQTQMMDEHQKRNDEQFNTLEKYLILKMESNNCIGCSADKKIDKLEIKVDEINIWRYIAIGAIVILGFIAPYILPKLF